MNPNLSFEEKLAHVEDLAYHARMAAMTLPTRGTCICDEKTAVMDQVYFGELGEYSTTLPTGTYFGKRWKRRIYTHVGCDMERHSVGPSYSRNSLMVCVRHVPQEYLWMMGEYYDVGDPKQIGIRWLSIIVV